MSYDNCELSMISGPRKVGGSLWSLSSHDSRCLQPSCSCFISHWRFQSGPLLNLLYYLTFAYEEAVEVYFLIGIICTLTCTGFAVYRSISVLMSCLFMFVTYRPLSISKKPWISTNES